jgi:hypothetical protein
MNGTNLRRSGCAAVTPTQCDRVKSAVAKVKAAVVHEYGNVVAEHAKILRLALNEAEALAWQTEFPHLFFPTLAMEKATSTVQWHKRQRAVRRKAAELAFAE